MGDIKNELAPLNAAYVHSGWLKFKNHRPTYTYTRVIMSLLSSLRRKKNHQVVFSNYNNYYSSADTQKSHKYLKKTKRTLGPPLVLVNLPKLKNCTIKILKNCLDQDEHPKMYHYSYIKKPEKILKIEDKISLFWNELLIINIIITLIIDHHYQSPALLLVTFKKKNTFWTCYEKWAHFLIYTILYIQTTKKQK